MLWTVGTRRVWTEFLSPEILAAPDTLALLQRYQLQPLIAMPPGREDHLAMASALQRLHRAGISLGLWPLLSDRDGYWPGSGNAPLACQRVAELLAFAQSAQIPIATVAMDLEPALALKREFQDASGWQRTRLLGARALAVRRPEARRAHAQAVRRYRRLADELRAAGMESLAIAVPPLGIDLAAGTEFWQAYFATPLAGPGWETCSPMFYRSMLQAALPGQRALWGRAIFAEACRQWGLCGGSVCMSLGVVGPGKLANEASYESPAQLAWDVACATELGLSDLALFSLESLLDRPNPEAWLDAFTSPSRNAAPTLAERMARQSLRALLAGAARLTRWL